jgi:peroxiredoxin Q/BCP
MRTALALGFITTLGAALLAQGAGRAGQGTPPPMVVKVGDMAPDFSLPGTDGKTHRLSDYRGKTAVVIAWFPRAFTAGCTIECKSLAENGDKIQKYEVTYFMASTDTLEDNTRFAQATTVTLQGRGGAPGTVVEKKEADFPMLSDPELTTARAYGVVTGERRTASRWTFYIDKSGRIAAIDTAVRPDTSAEDMLAKLTELKVPTRN